jgi:hypothetical protein
MTEDLRKAEEAFARMRADIRSEVFAAALASAGVPMESMYFRTQSTFRRSKAMDLDDVRIDKPETGDGQLVFSLNREGLYDMLPEGLFHFRDASGSHMTRDELFNDIKRSRQEEADARKFFGPFENEFFQHRLQLEMQEQRLLRKGNDADNRELFEKLYGPAPAIEDRYVLPLLHVMPVFHRIRGDISQVARCLSRFLDLPVHIEHASTTRHPATAEGLKALGQAVLGVDAVAGDRFDSAMPVYEVHVSDIPRAEVGRFFPDGGSAGVLEFLLTCLLPMECRYTVFLHLCKDQRILVLADEANESHLGYDVYI